MKHVGLLLALTGVLIQVRPLLGLAVVRYWHAPRCLQTSLGLRAELPGRPQHIDRHDSSVHLKLVCAVHALGLTAGPSVDQSQCATAGLPTWSADGPLGGLTVIVSQAASGSPTDTKLAPSLATQLQSQGLTAQAAVHMASLAYALHHAFRVTTTDGPCKQLSPAVQSSHVAARVPLMACVASSMDSAGGMLAAAPPAVRVVRVQQASSVSSAAVQALQSAHPQDIVLSIQAESVGEIVEALVGSSTAEEVQAIAKQTARRALSVPVATGAGPPLLSGNDTGNCTRPWTGAEIDDYQVYVWVIVLLVFMIASAFICLACTIAGDKDPVLYSAFQASDFHAHAD